MRQRFQNTCTILSAIFFIATGFTACNKATVNFGEEALTDDPNIIYIDSMTIDMATYQTDSFYTAGDTIFMAGLHIDSLLGSYSANAFVQLGLPAANNLKDRNNCIFDSLVLIIRFYGSYYGDTTEPFTLKVHQLTEQMKEESQLGYNNNKLAYNASPLGVTTFSHPRPSAREQFSVPLSQTLGQQLFRMLNKNSDTIVYADKFYKYFNGIVLSGEGANKRSVYYFANATAGSNAIMRLYYRENGVTPQSLYTDFPISAPGFQFNSFTYDKSGTALSVFMPKKNQVIPAASMGNRAFLHGNSGLFPTLNIPSLFSIKELHPYVKVVKAELEITPPGLNYGTGNFYPLPPAIALYTMSTDNRISTVIYDANGTSVQTGNLQIDYLYHKDTRYTYDLTAYINEILDKGRTSQKALAMIPISRSYESRLILDARQHNSSAKLKLYVLGL